MTIESAVNDGIVHDGDDVATNFSFPFKVNNATQVEVVLRDSNGDETVLTTNYTVNNPNVEGSGSVDYPTSGSPLATGDSLAINPKMDYKQSTDLRNQGRFSPETLEDAYDTLMMHIKELRGLVNRAVKFKKSSEITNKEFDDDPVDGRVLTWDGGTGKIKNGPSEGSISDAASNAAAAAASATLASEWAIKTDGQVASTDYSSKAWAIGGTGVTNTASRGAAKEWATKTGGTVDTSERSAKAYAQEDLTGAAGGSAKDWAITSEDSVVAGGEYSAKHYAAKAATSAALLPLPKYNATANPTVNDDSGDGYSAGSIWFNTTTGRFFRCADASVGAAVWQPFFPDFVNVKDFGATGDGSTDDSTAIQAAVTALSSGGICFFPKGNYLIDTKITMASNIKFMGEGYATTINKYGSSSDHFIFASSSSGTLSNVEMSNIRFTTDKVSASGTQSMINFDGPDVDNIKIVDCYFENTTAFCDSIFFKAASGKTITNIIISRNEFRSSDRMAIEFINHDNTSSYNISNIRICDNKISTCASMGVSLSGPVEQFVIANNNIEDCLTYGLEFAGGPRGGTVSGNVFSGTFTYLISNSNGGSYAVGNDITITGNSCNGQVTGDIRLENYGTGVISGNKWNLSGRFIFVNTNTFDCLFVGNSLISDSAIALICDDSPDNMIIGNYIDNSSQGSNQSTVRAFDTSTTGIILMGNTIYKGTGGNSYDATSGATFATVRNNIIAGVPEDEVIKDYRIYKDRGLVTTSGTTSTCTITFASSGSWRPQTVKAAVTNCETGSANGGHAETHWGVRTNNSASTVQIVQTDISTSANCVISDSYGNQTMTITATVPGAGAQVLWDLEIIGWGLVQSVVFA